MPTEKPQPLSDDTDTQEETERLLSPKEEPETEPESSEPKTGTDASAGSETNGSGQELPDGNQKCTVDPIEGEGKAEATVPPEQLAEDDDVEPDAAEDETAQEQAPLLAVPHEHEHDSGDATVATSTAQDATPVRKDPAAGSAPATENERTEGAAASTSASPPPSSGAASEEPARLWKEPVVKYRSISVERYDSDSETAIAGTLSIVERDQGTQHDLTSIWVHLVWAPRQSFDPSAPAPIEVSVDDFLALRIVLHARPHPRMLLFAQGGTRLATFGFPNGRDAAMQFVAALQQHLYFVAIEERTVLGDLYSLESKPRMRRVAPELEDTDDGAEPSAGQDGPGQDPSNDSSANDSNSSVHLGPHAMPSNASQGVEATNLANAMAIHRRRMRRARADIRDPDSGMFRPGPPPPGLLILEQFAKVTQLARDVGEDMSWLFSDKRRQEENARRERERLARQRALDIYAEAAGSDGRGEHRELPQMLQLDKPRGKPLSRDGWMSAFDSEGRLSDPTLIRLAVFSGGVEPELRAAVWPFLLGVFPWDSTDAQRHDIMQRNLDRYATLKAHRIDMKTAAMSADAAALAAAMEQINKEKEQSGGSARTPIPERHARVSKQHQTALETEEQIAKDIVRTDRNVDAFAKNDSRLLSMMGDILSVYAAHNRSIGYCQGMSDFLSPLLYVFGEQQEAHAFWCFESLMQRVQLNFRIDQSGINAQLVTLRSLLQESDRELFDHLSQIDPDFYCAFRWVLVWFKRELPFQATSRLWEVFWSRMIADDSLHLYVAVGILRAHRRYLLQLPVGEFDRLLRYVNDLNMRIDVDFALKQAEICFRDCGAM